MQTIYVTKYALTQGILEFQAEVKAGMALVTNSAGYKQYYHCLNRDWHQTRERALKYVEEMKTLKVASLERQIKRIQALTFTLDSISKA